MSGTAGIILAGGRASRMGGRDKALLPLAGRPLIAHAIERLGGQAEPLAINANGDPARFSGFGLPVVPDRDDTFSGPLAGVLAGMRWAAGLAARPEAIVTVAVDTPFFPIDLVAKLTAEASGKSIAIAASGGLRHPTFAVWPVALADDLERFIATGATLKVTAFADALGAVTVDFPGVDGIDPFFNINAPGDLALAEAHLETPT